MDTERPMEFDASGEWRSLREWWHSDEVQER